jgi:hypothetical protein
MPFTATSVPPSSAAAALRNIPFASPDVSALESKIRALSTENTRLCQVNEMLRQQLHTATDDANCKARQLESREVSLSTQIDDMRKVSEERDQLKRDFAASQVNHTAMVTIQRELQGQLRDKEQMREECVSRQTRIAKLEQEKAQLSTQLRMVPQAQSVQAFLEISDKSEKFEHRSSLLEQENECLSSEVDKLRREILAYEQSEQSRTVRSSGDESLGQRLNEMEGYRKSYEDLHYKYLLLSESQRQVNDKPQATIQELAVEKGWKEDFWRRCGELSRSNQTLESACRDLATAREQAETLLWRLAGPVCEVLTFLSDSREAISAENRVAMATHLEDALAESREEAKRRLMVASTEVT